MKGVENYELGGERGEQQHPDFLRRPQSQFGAGCRWARQSPPPHAPLNLGLLFPTDLGEGKQRGLSGYKLRLEQQLRDRTH